MIKIQSVVPEFFTPASSEVWSKNFELDSNANYLIKAVSGSGKSSFFNFLYGLNNKYSGEISFDNAPISIFTESEWSHIRREKISIVFQGLCLFPELTVLENIQLKNQLTQYKTEAEIFKTMDSLDIEHLAHRKAETLSFGQKQRVAIVRALCQPFDLILLDEPFSHIDETQIHKAVELIQKEVKVRQATMILASLGDHYAIDYTQTFKL